MKVIDQSKLHIETAHEAYIVGQLAERGADDQSGMFILKHAHEKVPIYEDEVAFFNREQQHGPLLTSKHVARLAIQGAQKIAESDVSFRSINPDLAVYVVAIWEHTLSNDQNELPHRRPEYEQYVPGTDAYMAYTSGSPQISDELHSLETSESHMYQRDKAA